MKFDHLLVIGFGGPASREEIRPFLERVAKGTRIPEARLSQVEQQYEQIGGFSPYNKHARRLFDALAARLKAGGVNLPAFLAMKNTAPSLAEAFREIGGRGLNRELALVLAPHRSDASFGKYQRAVEEAKQEAGAGGVRTGYVGPWHDHPLFIEAQADQVRRVLPEGEEALLVFTAHSIPAEMARACGYEREILRSAEAVCARLGVSDFCVAYQSRSGDPRQPWLGPDIPALIPEWKQRGIRRVALVPVGFLLDHAEVLYDLDILARQTLEREGIEVRRASTVMDHPKFVEMLAGLIREELG